MLLALETTQKILMVLSFAAMLVSVAIAIWLWLRHRNVARAGTPRAQRRSSAHAEAPRPAVQEPEPCIHEVTEFIALPHLREMDAPRPDATEIVAVDHRPPPAGERTEFVPRPAERTEIVALPAERTEIVAPLPERAELFVPEKTESIRAPLPLPRSETATRSEFDLPEHLRLAIDAFELSQTGTPAPQLDGHLDVLGSLPGNVLLELVRPMLVRSEGHRLAAALLVLLHNKTWPAKAGFASLLAELDEPRKRTALELLRSWDDPRAQSIAAGCLTAAGDNDSRLLWLGCFADAGWDPGAAAIEAALADPDPRIQACGLRLVPRSDAASRLQTKLGASLFASDPNVRMQAIEAALGFGDPSAWLVCRQLARNPGFPGAAQLVGLLATEAEIIEQCRSFESAPTPELLAGLGLSGRPVVLRACSDRFDDGDPKLSEAARATLTLAAGTSFPSAADARAWALAQQHPRLLGGARRSASSVLAQLAIGDAPTRRVLARELRIRSHGRIHVDASLLPHAFARQLERLGPRVLEIDFERGVPW